MMAVRLADLEMDLQDLISCIECHEEEKNVDVIIETLKTIISICSEEECGKDAFRDVGGLDFLLDFIANTDQVAILEFGLKVLAFIVDENVHNQMHLTHSKVFKLLQVIFEKRTYPLAVLKNAVVLFPTILFQNRTAQELIREENYLGCLINLYKQYVPRSTIYSNSSTEDPEHLEIWLNVNSALCFAVNNPLNEKNQVMCSCLFPLSVTTLDTSNSVIIDASSSFLALSIANNEKNQDTFAEYDGFLILKRCLNKSLELMLSDIKECNSVISKGTMQAISCLIGIISAAVVDNGKNAALCGELGIVSQMVEFLSIDVLNSSVKKKAILVLGQCIDAFCDNKSFILDVPEFDLLLKKNLETDDNDLCYATKYLLHVCLYECEDKLQRTNIYSATAVSSQRNSPNLLHKRYEDNTNQQIKSIAEASSKCYDHRNSQENVLHEENKFTNSSLKFQNDPLSLQEKIDLLNSISDKELKFHTIKNPNKFNFNASNLFTHNDFDSNIMSHQKRQRGKQHIQRITKDSLEVDDKNSKYDSLDEISLQSACHFYKLNKIRLQKASRESKDFNDRLNTINNEFTIIPNKRRKHNLNMSKLSKCSTVKKTKYSHDVSMLNISKACQSKNCSNCSCLSKMKDVAKTFSREDHVKCSNMLNFKPAPISNSKQKNLLSNIPLDILSLRCNQSLSDRHSSKETAKYKSKNSHSSCTNVISHGVSQHKPINACSVLNSSNITNCKQIFEFNDSHSAVRMEASNNIDNTDIKDISKQFSINLEPFPTSCSKAEAKGKSKCHINQISASKMPPKQKGCVQVIALPGPSCSLHKITSHFEMLKVCPLQDV